MSWLHCTVSPPNPSLKNWAFKSLPCFLFFLRFPVGFILSRMVPSFNLDTFLEEISASKVFCLLEILVASLELDFTKSLSFDLSYLVVLRKNVTNLVVFNGSESLKAVRIVREFRKQVINLKGMVFSCKKDYIYIASI